MNKEIVHKKKGRRLKTNTQIKLLQIICKKRLKKYENINVIYLYIQLYKNTIITP